MSGLWNTESIRLEREKKLDRNMSREQMLERILDLEVALYPLAFTFHSLDGLANYWTSELNSNLIPIADGRGNIMVSSAEKAGYVEIPPQDTWHQVGIVPRSGIDVSNSPKIHDDFEILSVIMSGPGAGGSGGVITMGDVRRATESLGFK